VVDALRSSYSGDFIATHACHYGSACPSFDAFECMVI
jgi:hypothetical protein